MPDGTIVTNVPEGTTKAELLAKLEAYKTKPTEPEPAEPSSFMRRLGDVGLSTAQGIVGAGEGLLGLADIPTMGHAGRGAEIAEKAVFGGTSKDLQAYLESLKSPEAKLAQQKVADVKGFFPTAGAMLENPSTIAGSVAESLPSVATGAGLARTAIKAFPSLAKKTLGAAAAGEGAMSAGSTAESIRQQEESGLITPGQAAISGVSGALTGGLGIFGGKVADYFKVGDIDRLMVGGLDDFAKNIEKQSIVKAAVKGAISESLFEELHQSMQEQISQNVATGKPWDEGVAEAGAMGVMSALVMGGGAAGASQIAANARVQEQKNRAALAETKPEIKTDNSMFQEQDADDEAAAQATTQPPVDTSFNTTALEEPVQPKQPAQTLTAQEAEAKREAEHPYGDTMIDEETGFPLFAPRAEKAGQDWATLVQDDKYLANNDLSTEIARRDAIHKIVGKINTISKNVATDDSDIAYARNKGKNELADTLELQYASEKERLAKEQAKLAALQQYLSPTELEYLEQIKSKILGDSSSPLFARREDEEVKQGSPEHYASIPEGKWQDDYLAIVIGKEDAPDSFPEGAKFAVQSGVHGNLAFFPTYQEANQYRADNNKNLNYIRQLGIAKSQEPAPLRPGDEAKVDPLRIAQAKVNEAIRNNDEAGYEKALEELKIAREKAQTIQPGYQAPLFAGKKEVEEEAPFDYEAFKAQLEENKATIARLKAYYAERDAKKLPGIEQIEDEYRRAGNAYRQASRALDRVKAYSPDFWFYSDEAKKADAAMDRYMLASSNLDKAKEGIEFEGYQRPLFAQQQGLDFTQEMPVAPEGQAAVTPPRIGQQGLDFTQEQQGKYTPPEVKAPKFGFTTETSAEPLLKFLSRFKPRSTSEVERDKQQAALFGIRDESGKVKTSGLLDKISELYEDTTPEQQQYYKGVIDSFFDKYAGVERPSKKAALKNINNLSAEDQNRVLKDYTRLPDLTTYEGVKKLSDAFDDHIAEAELAGLGITKASSAYRQADSVVRNLRKKPQSTYDESERAAYSYFDMYGLDLALRSAAFDVAVNTPRNQLFRGQGKEAGLQFGEWLKNNAPAKVTNQFEKYLHAYKKQYEGYKAFQEIQTTKESEAETVADYIASNAGPKRSEGAKRALPVHPLVVKHIRNNDLQKALIVIESTAQGPFQRRLANRLAQLQLKTTVGVDKVDVLAEDYTVQTRKYLGKILGMADVLMPDEFISDEGTARELGLEIWDKPNQDMQVRFKMAKAIVEAVKRAAKDNKIESSALNDAIKDAEENINGVLEGYTAAGVYFPISDSISLDSKQGLNVPVILHEIMHAGTARIVNNPKLYSSKQQEAVKELTNLYEIAKLRADGKYYYGLTNLNEFIAEAFTDRKFQEFLKGIKYRQSNMSLWDKFVQYCLEMFGYDNVLSSTIANVNELFDAPDNGATFDNPPPLFAKRNKGMFESNSAERSKPFAILTDLVKNTKTFSDIKGNLAEALTTMNTQTRKTWLGALTLRQMNEMLGSEFGLDEKGKFRYLSRVPQISRYLRKVEKMGAERSKVLEMHTAITRKLELIQRKNKPTIDKLNEIIQFATVNEVDPAGNAPKPVDPNAPTKKEQAQIDAYPSAKLMWDNLGRMKDGAQAQKLYKEMRDFFSTRLDEFKAVAYEREFNRQLAEGISQSKKAGETVNEDDIRKSAKAAIDTKFSDKITPYFPLKRFGRFWVRVGSGDNKIYMQFEDAKAQADYIKKERNKLANNLKRQGATDEQIESALEGNKYINMGNNLPDLANDLFSSRKVFDEVISIVDTGGKDITDVEELRKLMVDQLGELYTTTLPLQSIQRMFLHRQNISGASADLIRSFQHAAMHMAYQHARFKYAPKLDEELSAAKSTIASLKKTNADDGAILEDYLDAINLKHKENIITPADSPKWLNVASNLNFMWFLTAPASAIVNMLAVPSIALPVMSGKYGTTKSAKTLGKYVKLLASAGWKTLDTGEFDTPSIIRSSKLSSLQKRAYESASAGLFEQSLAHDAANFSENPSLNYTGRWGRIMEIATFPFHKAERFNREITYMAAFELAYEKNGGNFDEAVNEASDLTYKTMFDYATFNKPRLMQGNLSKLIFAFKQYPQHFTYLLLRTGFEATQKVSDAEIANLRAAYKDRGEEAVKKYIEDTNAMRAEARKAFMMMMGMTFLFAGAAGLPMWWMYEGMANAFNAVFGDDEIPYDVNNEFKNKMNEVFGGFAGDSISRGFIPQLTGISLSDRMSTNLTDMWFRDVKQNQDEVAYAQNMIISLLGPTVGIGMKIPEAIQRFNDGHVERAAEALAPAAFKNILAGSRLAKEGALTMKGDTLIEDISGPEAFKQMLGFTPEKLAQRQSANIEAKSYEQAVLQRRQDLLNFLAMAIERDDADAEAKVLAKIDEFNDANDWAVIKGSTIRSSLKKRAKAKAMADEFGGLNINKNFRDLAEEQTGYAEDEDEE